MRNATHEVLTTGPLEIRIADFLAVVDGEVATFTPREFGLLLAFARRPERVIPREVLYELVWERPMAADDRAVDVYVRKLRAKLAEAAPDWAFIHTHPLLGYRFDPHRAEPDRAMRSGLSKEKM